MDLLTLFDDLVRVEIQLWNALDARLRAECDVPLGSLKVLRVIAETPECRVQEVAGALTITVGGASQSVDRLERRQLCVRTPHPRNRRSSVLELTEAGRRLLAEGNAVQKRHLREVLGEALTAEDRERLGKILQALQGGAASAP
ncbi:MarR family winged helix-turn-helix transcriptional regulator [Actinoplanes sp. TFC3]|uniref:MarR family winged helix-turn-helix transcriptional regulator n=1 Tax=Actinoplanes sp. TFC3 TaxID=1710355 RepID=UPI0009EAAAEC|nr:MarR family winged helix-turn-helix transcriptional regulator [Actinoplanes sp. TFC3]